jgi:hypothetical protein
VNVNAVGGPKDERDERCDEQQVHEPFVRQVVTSFRS